MRLLLTLLASAAVVSACSSFAVKESLDAGRPVSGDGAYHYITGYDRELRGDLDGAIADYEKAIQNDPESLDLPVQLGSALLKAGRTGEALVQVQAVLDRDGSYVPALRLLAELHMRERRNADAVRTYERVVKLEPEDSDAWLHLGSLLQGEGRDDDAIKAFETVRALNPDGFMANYYLGNIYLRRESYEKARFHFEQILRMRPDFEPVRINLGFIEEQTNHPDKAIEHYRAVLETNPGNRRVRERIGRLLLQGESYEKAINEYRRLQMEDPSNLEFLFRLGVAYFEASQLEEAEEAFLKLLELSPTEQSARFYLGLIYEEREEYEHAIEQYRLIAESNGNDVQSRIRRGFLLGRLDRLTEAIEAYKEVLEIDDSIPEVYLYLGSALVQSGDLDAAQETFVKGLSLATENEDEFLFNMAVVEEKRGRFDEMIELLKDTLAKNPDHADALNYLGYSYAERGIHLDEAQRFIERALDLNPDSGYIRDSYAWVLYQQGLYDRALAEQLKAAELVNNDPIIFDHLGDIYLKLGERLQAQESWERSLEVVGDNGELEEKLREKLKLP